MYMLMLTVVWYLAVQSFYLWNTVEQLLGCAVGEHARDVLAAHDMVVFSRGLQAACLQAFGAANKAKREDRLDRVLGCNARENQRSQGWRRADIIGAVRYGSARIGSRGSFFCEAGRRAHPSARRSHAPWPAS